MSWVTKVTTPERGRKKDESLKEEIRHNFEES